MNKKLAALGGLAAVFAAGGTLAYFNQTMGRTNIFDTGDYHTVLVEEFKPEDGENWEPGATINKDITVKNTGTVPVAVRVTFQEKWETKAREGQERTLLYEADMIRDRGRFADPAPVGENKLVNVYQGNAGDGLTGVEADDSVVHKEIDPLDMWVYNPADGYYYYKEVVPGRSDDGTVYESAKILDSITLDRQVDMGEFLEVRYYTKEAERPRDDSDRWIPFATYSQAQRKAEEGQSKSTKLTPEQREWLQEEEATYLKSSTIKTGNNGYSSADYTLTATIQTVQATQSAINAVFGENSTFVPPKGCRWELSSETVSAAEE